MAVADFQVTGDQHRARRIGDDTRCHRRIHQLGANAPAAFAGAEDDQVVMAQFPLFENAGGHIGGYLELEHDQLALLVSVFDLVVAQRIAFDAGVDALFRPVVAHVAQFDEHIPALLQVLDAGQFETPFEHVLTGHAHLQAAGTESLVDQPHIDEDDIGIDATPDFGGIAEPFVGFVGAVNTHKNAEPVVPRIDSAFL